LTNIEEEHLDFYKGGLKQIMETFKKYVNHLGEDGVLVANGQDKNVMKIAKNAKCKVMYY
jgi:UDP-N-acetylmuramate--alanine ligase